MRVLDLFSGIGGFSLGLERAGMETVAFCEIEPYCRTVLKKHWPDVPIYDDVRTLTAARLAADGILGVDVADAASARTNGHASGTASQYAMPGITGVDLICGGFPCQDISVAGKGAGIEGERSGLWSEYARIIGEVRPRYVIVENVAALLGRGLSRVLGDLATLGYDAEWHCIPASAVGAPHQRDRLWIVAYSASFCGTSQPQFIDERRPLVGTGIGTGRRDFLGHLAEGISGLERDSITTNVADAWRHEAERCGPSERPARKRDWWLVEPDVGRVAHGVPARVERLRSLGNAVVPQIPELIGRAILAEAV